MLQNLGSQHDNNTPSSERPSLCSQFAAVCSIVSSVFRPQTSSSYEPTLISSPSFSVTSPLSTYITQAPSPSISSSHTANSNTANLSPSGGPTTPYTTSSSSSSIASSHLYSPLGIAHIPSLSTTPSALPSTATGGSNKQSDAPIIGGVIGVIVVLILIGVFIACYIRRRRRRRRRRQSLERVAPFTEFTGPTLLPYARMEGKEYQIDSAPPPYGKEADAYEARNVTSLPMQ